jgi:uncharacterized membrane protein
VSARPDAHGAFGQDAFGRRAERAARFFGTPQYIVGQSLIVVAWVVLNAVALISHWDPYPFILLNLAFSTQAAYAAPLILLAQNRQDDRDRAQIERDRAVAARTQADTEYLAREVATIRLALADLPTARDLADLVARLERSVDRLEGDR